jgi:ribosomal protein S18 acetylase RimI-like enzyme
MATSASIEILDLRHFSAPMFHSVLDVESELWKQRLHWDYRNSARLLMQYLDNRMLPGFAALTEGRITGYVFCVYEETKAVIGDIFALPDSPAASAPATEETLLKHLFELLLNSPQIERIESQLLLHPSGFHRDLFREAGFELYRRLFMMRTLEGVWSLPQVDLPSELELRPWRDEDLMPAARLIAESYRNHPDSLVNDQYRSTHGAMRFLNNIVRYAGCGPFSAPASHVVVHRHSQELVALLLGSRVSSQLCVHPDCRRHGLARLLLSIAAFHFMRQGASEISLTVTEANTQAIELYHADGYTSAHAFDAAVWQRNPRA